MSGNHKWRRTSAIFHSMSLAGGLRANPLAVRIVGAVVHRQRHYLGTDVDPRIEIGNVFVGEADATGRNLGADGRWRVRTSADNCTKIRLVEPSGPAFGGCDGKIPNCLPIMNGWNYTVRLCRARPELLNGQWKFPEPRPAG
jgi:hypothetical protein